MLSLGATWNKTWRSVNGSTQLHLLTSAFPPPLSRKNIAAYTLLLGSALTPGNTNTSNLRQSSNSLNGMSGLDPTLEDETGKNAFFIFCERLASVSTNAFADTESIVQLFLRYPTDNNSNKKSTKLVLNSSTPVKGEIPVFITRSDRTGKTVFDIDEIVDKSCLSVAKSLLSSSISRSTQSSRASHHGLRSSGDNDHEGISSSKRRSTSVKRSSSDERESSIVDKYENNPNYSNQGSKTSWNQLNEEDIMIDSMKTLVYPKRYSND